MGIVGMASFGRGRVAGARSGPGGMRAVRAGDFLDSMGVCSSITGRGETLSGTIDALRHTAIRFIRCGIEDGISVGDMIDLHRQTGAKIAYGLLSGGTDLGRLLADAGQLASAGALLAVEGNNEPNNWGITYEGEAGGRDRSWVPVAKLQRDLYQAIQADSVLRGYPVWNISESGAQTDNVGLQFLTIPDGAGVLMPDGTRYADFANCHNYITHKSDGTFELVLWGERFTGGSDQITVTLGETRATANVYDPTTGTSPMRILADADSVAVTLSNHPMIVELPPARE